MEDHAAAEVDALRRLDAGGRDDDGVGAVRRECPGRWRQHRVGRLAEQASACPALPSSGDAAARRPLHLDTTRAGLPATTAPGGTSVVTMEWWSTMLPSPTVTPGS